jgi:hypothetical protein
MTATMLVILFVACHVSFGLGYYARKRTEETE